MLFMRVLKFYFRGLFEGLAGDALRARSGGTKGEVEAKGEGMTVHAWANIWARTWPATLICSLHLSMFCNPHPEYSE